MVHPRSLTQLFQLFIGFSWGCLVCAVFPCLSEGTGAVFEALQALPRWGQCPELMRSCWKFRACCANGRSCPFQGGSRQDLALLGHNEPRSWDKLPFVVSLCSCEPANTSFPGCWLMFLIPGFGIWILGVWECPRAGPGQGGCWNSLSSAPLSCLPSPGPGQSLCWSCLALDRI